jgi:CubicO group peptidase (beta-lactamase class C family)
MGAVVTDVLRSHGQWRASVRDEGGWRDVRAAEGPYARGSLVEWGSITKGIVGTTACRAFDTTTPVADVLPSLAVKGVTVGDLVGHTSGLPRMPRGMTGGLFRDPYRASAGRPLDLDDVVPVAPRGEYLYSNLGYALLGAVLDHVHGNWLDAAREHVLRPAGIESVTLAPDPAERVLPTWLFGRVISPWRLATSPYAAAGGVWSTFDDLCRYADWCLSDGPRSDRLVGWQRAETTTWINGEVRASGAAIVRARGKTAVVHALAQAPHAADRLATSIHERESR